MKQKLFLSVLLFYVLSAPVPIFSEAGKRLTLSLNDYLILKKNNQQLLEEYEKQQNLLKTYREQYKTLEQLKNSNITLLHEWKKKLDDYIVTYKKAYEKQQKQLSALETQLQNIQAALTRVETSLEKMPKLLKGLERAHTGAILKSSLLSAGIGLVIGVIGFLILYFVVPNI